MIDREKFNDFSDVLKNRKMTLYAPKIINIEDIKKEKEQKSRQISINRLLKRAEELKW